MQRSCLYFKITGCFVCMNYKSEFGGKKADWEAVARDMMGGLE